MKTNEHSYLVVSSSSEAEWSQEKGGAAASSGDQSGAVRRPSHAAPQRLSPESCRNDSEECWEMYFYTWTD